MKRVIVCCLVFAFCACLGITSSASRTAAQSACGQWEFVDNGFGGPFTGLTGVTAMSPDDVWALGGHYVTNWNGTTWTDSALPDLDPNGFGFDLRAMGCLPTGQMWTAGIIANDDGYPYYSDILLVHWDGTQWDRFETVHLAHQTVWPFNPRSGSPADIDGASEDDVWVVGIASGYGDGGTSPCLALHWDGSDWIETAVPSSGGGDQQFEAVAAIAPDDVWAVGYGEGGPGGRKGITYHWDGTQWNYVHNPSENQYWTFLYDVVAISSDDVWAAGEMLGETLFMHWDGTSWTIVDGPGTEVIYGLAAIATDDVWAVGWPDGYHYHWDGTAWSQVESPVVPGTSVNRTGGLAAAGPCDVWGVGGYFVGNENHALTERLQSGGVSSSPDITASRLVLTVAPNPMFHGAEIRFDLRGEAIVSAAIYDARGRRVRSLAIPFDGRDSGVLRWNGRNDAGLPVPAGAYYLRVESAAGNVLTRTLSVAR